MLTQDFYKYFDLEFLRKHLDISDKKFGVIQIDYAPWADKVVEVDIQDLVVYAIVAYHKEYTEELNDYIKNSPIMDRNDLKRLFNRYTEGLHKFVHNELTYERLESIMILYGDTD